MCVWIVIIITKPSCCESWGFILTFFVIMLFSKLSILIKCETLWTIVNYWYQYQYWRLSSLGSSLLTNCEPSLVEWSWIGLKPSNVDSDLALLNLAPITFGWIVSELSVIMSVWHLLRYQNPIVSKALMLSEFGAMNILLPDHHIWSHPRVTSVILTACLETIISAY